MEHQAAYNRPDVPEVRIFFELTAVAGREFLYG
jgi:hypothetical protein